MQNTMLFLRAILLATLLAASPTWAQTLIVGKVVALADGDTLTVLDADHVQHKIRLAGIDTPERKQPFGQRAKHHPQTWFLDARSKSRPKNWTATVAASARYLSMAVTPTWPWLSLGSPGITRNTSASNQKRTSCYTQWLKMRPELGVLGFGGIPFRSLHGTGGLGCVETPGRDVSLRVQVCQHQRRPKFPRTWVVQQAWPPGAKR